MSAGSSTPRTPRSVRSTLQRAVFGAADSSLLSLESLPLTEGGFRPRPSYGSIFSYYHMLRRGSVLGSNKTLQRSDSMVSLCYRSLLHFVTEDNLPGLQNFLENKRVLVDDKDENGGTVLHYAASRGKLSFVRELINHGADVNIEDNDNWTALLCAAKEGHTAVCLELLDHGADIDHRDMGGWSSLMWATYKNHVETVSLLLEHNADVNAHGNYHISSLIWAVGRGYVDITRMLVQRGAKVNVGDKYGTSALVWACRKGNPEIVECLLRAGANVDTAGMYSWTPLLVATMGNHVEVVNLLLESKPNVNALDKDGCTALTIACKEGFHDIAVALLNVGAYINIQDRSGDTNLIHAVKGGHRSVVEALLKKYADVDIPGKERKTAMYTSVEKGNIAVMKLLMSANPDLEIATKDGDTCLLRAVRSRNVEAVQLLLEKKARVSASDKRGDTALHIAMRARSKGIVEVLLRNPKNSQLLYRPNRAGETPYNIDMNHQKTILGQIFGARRLNTNEDNEKLLGYDLYSSALADMVSEPSLSMPITVGLYAKWGSGKSFLLNKLREEMKNFARQWVDPTFQFSWLLMAIIVHLAALSGTVVSLSLTHWLPGIVVIFTLLILTYTFLAVVWYGSNRYSWDWPYNLNVYLTRKMNAIKVVLQVIFCHPPGAQWSDSFTAQPIRFYFTDQTRVSSSAAGENSVVQMIGSLYDSIENDYGALSTRLYRALRPKALKSTSSWRWRKLCCLPNIIFFELCYAAALVGGVVLTIYIAEYGRPSYEHKLEEMTCQIVLGMCLLVVVLLVVANLYTISRVIKSLLFSQRRQLQRAIAKLDTLKSEGFLQALRSEVNLMTDMVKCLDAFTQQQTRLVIIVDGLDSCEQDKVLMVLDAVHVLFSEPNTPFIIILAIDPHVISKAVEVNSRRLLSESNIGGHDYLRNMVHLPFFLQNSGLRKVKTAQKSAHSHRKSVVQAYDQPESNLVTSASARRLSTESGGLSSQEKLKLPGSSLNVARKGSRKLKLSDSIASSLGSNLNRAGGAQDLTKMLLTDDYFSDVNPRSMRRLMNVVYITGRLLKAFQIDFNWYHLASWVNITEQWPFRTSWLIMAHDSAEDSLDDNTSLKTLYDKIRPQIPTSKEVEPLLELDRDERKFDIFLSFHRSSLLVSDLRVFLPFTINLDPYIKKVIKEDIQSLEESGLMMTPAPGAAQTWQSSALGDNPANLRRTGLMRRQKSLQKMQSQPTPIAPGVMFPGPAVFPTPWAPVVPGPRVPPFHLPVAVATSLPAELLDVRLSTLSTEGVCQLLSKVDETQGSQVAKYTKVFQTNNISGKVLLYCDMDDLKPVVQMGFGDWEIFRMVIVSLREQELTAVSQLEETVSSRNVRFAHSQERARNPSNKGQTSSNPPPEKERVTAKQTVMEKQVSLEEQMICGALQTLNEEAMEDVLEEVDDPSTCLQVPDQGEGRPMRARTLSQGSYSDPNETNVLIFQHTSPLQPPYWTPAPTPGGSAASSLANTPVLHRKRRDSKTPVRSQPNSRPVSLLVAVPGEEESLLHPSLMSSGEDSHPQGTGKMPSFSTSTLSKVASSLLGSRRNTLVSAPAVTITPAGSVETLNRSVRYNTTDQSSDDESTPLMSELSSPTHNADFANRAFASPPSSDLSPCHDGPQGYSGSPLYPTSCQEEIRLSSRLVTSLSRQDAVDSEDEVQSPWDDPETTV
ncbi:kinase D-interacting substrate of 220 kDa B isoform X2 [Homalodisca vitripennis]|uniref:kinase D-interacting substrate of 220 kDa B isoform X2 n=1 Tax=Homalodisca vitripennis TaxID=197043 RepID=UPI001EEAC591|nr:kinase D-interacting substrate of 220 kDa B isoform X2 [Homalodisca vitripennis]